MAKYSHKVKGKEVGAASSYAEPHTMTGKKVTAKDVTNVSGAKFMAQMDPSVASIDKGNYPAVKTSGIKIRGTGAATKGVTARGPMA